MYIFIYVYVCKKYNVISCYMIYIYICIYIRICIFDNTCIDLYNVISGYLMLDIYIYIYVCIPLINLRQPVVNQCSPCRDGWWAAPWIQVPHVHLTQARSDQRYSQGKMIRPWVTSHHPNLSIRISQHPTGWWLGT